MHVFGVRSTNLSSNYVKIPCYFYLYRTKNAIILIRRVPLVLLRGAGYVSMCAERIYGLLCLFFMDPSVVFGDVYGVNLMQIGHTSVQNQT